MAKKGNFSWLFKKFIAKVNPLIFQAKAGYSNKTIYSWALNPDDPYYRKDVITRAMEVLDVIEEEIPELLYQALAEINRRYGYVPVKEENFKSEEDIKLSKLMKELHDVPQAEVEILEDGKITKEEILRYLNEIDEALAILNQKRAIVRQKVLSLKEEYWWKN